MLIDQPGKADQGPSAGMPKDLRSRAKDLPSAATKNRRQLSKARVIASEEVVRLWGEREKKSSEKADRAVAREKKK